MDTYEKRKVQNKVAQANRRNKLILEMGIEKYHEEMARIARENYNKRKSKRSEAKHSEAKKNELKQSEVVKSKISTNLYVKDYVNNIFNDFINNIPKNKTSSKTHIGIEIEQQRNKGRPAIYIIKEGMMENEKKLVEQKIKKREYQKIYMRKKRQSIKQQNELK